MHTSARDARDTDWSQVVALYDQLVRLDPSPIVALNRAVAVAELDGPEVALAAVDRLDSWPATTPSTPPGPTCCAGSAARRSRAAYDRAIELAGNTAEAAYLRAGATSWLTQGPDAIAFSSPTPETYRERLQSQEGHPCPTHHTDSRSRRRGPR